MMKEKVAQLWVRGYVGFEMEAVLSSALVGIVS